MSKSTYKVPALEPGKIHRNEIVIKKSRFISSLARTCSVDEAKSFIDSICKEFHDARHNCFAYNADKPNSSGYAGCSDDGEPHGTAGQPMLNVLLHSDIGQITVVVTRYFGGILLGTGGLVKAYQDSVKLALDTLCLEDMVLTDTYSLVLALKDITLAQRLFNSYKIKVLDQVFTHEASFKLAIPQDVVEPFKAQINTITQGKGKLVKL